MALGDRWDGEIRIAKNAIEDTGAMRTVLVFIAATILAYLAIVFGWIAYADFAGVADREGGLGMGVVFIIGPICSVLLGIAAALIFGGKRASRQMKIALIVAGLLLLAWALLSLFGL